MQRYAVHAPLLSESGSMGWWGMVCAQHTVACVCMGWARVARAWVRELSHEGQNLGFQFHIVLALSVWLLPYYYYPYVIPHSYFVALSLAFFLLLFCLCYRTFNYLVKLGTQVTLLLLLSHSYLFDLLLFCSCSFALLHLITWVKPGTHASLFIIHALHEVTRWLTGWQLSVCDWPTDRPIN